MSLGERLTIIGIWLGLLALLSALLAVAWPASAAPLAQATETPAPTVTPVWQTAVVLSSGRTLIIERTYSLGEAANTLVGVALIILALWQVVLEQERRWKR